MNYPPVHDEFETLKALQNGKSIARFGDGEFKLIFGGDQIREPANQKLADELRAILKRPHRNCLLGIPTMDPKGPKYPNWKRHIKRYEPLLRGGGPYYSAFITRPDSAPWIATRQYAEDVQSLWAGKRVALVCERENKIFKVVKNAADKMIHLPCPHRETYAIIDQLELDIVRGRAEVAVLSCGPAATCLANRLAAKGVRALDLGSMGGFLSRMLDFEPLGDLRICVLRKPEGMSDAEMRAKLEEGFDVLYFEEKSK